MTEMPNTRLMALGVASNCPDVENLIERARKVEEYLDYRDLKLPVPDFAGLVQTVTSLGAAQLDGHIDPPASNTVTLTGPMGGETGAAEAPTRKPRGPNKPKAAKKASGKKRGRPARAEAVAEKDRPIANANGTGEHTPAPITGDEPQPIAA